jgi:hypothetical protein
MNYHRSLGPTRGGGLPISKYYITTLNRLGKEWNLRVDKERREG